MAIDISQDLNINVTVISVETKTLTDVYNTGSPAGTYLPGKDFSANDNVSTGNVTSYKLGIALSSKTNQSYPIDKLFLQSVDDPKTNGMGMIPLYWINTNTDPENIVDDGLYTPVSGYSTNMISVVLDSNSGVTSTSTVNLTLNVNYPNGIIWKTKIAPKIKAVALKDGIEKKSDELKPLEVKMSSKADFVSKLSTDNTQFDNIRLETKDGVKGFTVPIYLESNKQNISGINRLLDTPIFDTTSYFVNLNFTIDGTPIELTLPNIVSSQIPFGYSLLSSAISGGIYNIVLKKDVPSSEPFPRLKLDVFLPYDPGTKTQVTLAANCTWNALNNGGVNLTNWQNEYIFDKTQTGNVNRSVVIPLVFENLLTLSDFVSGSYRTNKKDLTAIFSTSFNDFISILGSKFLLFLDSEVANISNSPQFLQINYNDNGINKNYSPSVSDYTTQYGYVDLSSPYDANSISQLIFNGGITLGSYQDIINTGNTPNVLITTVLNDVLSGLNIDDGTMRIFYEGNTLDSVTSAQFKAMYDANPANPFNTYLYTGIQLGTNFLTVADANTKYGSLLAAGDLFELKNGKVYLYLSTRNPGQNPVVARFRTNSTVRADIPVPKLTAEFTTAIAGNDLIWINDIYDYTETYSLKYFVSPVAFTTTGWGTFLQGSQILLSVPSTVLPNIYIAGTPKIFKRESSATPTFVATISNYSLTPQGIKLIMPQNQLFLNQYYIDVPVKFLTPSNDKLFTHNPTTIDESKFLLTQPAEITTGFPASTIYFDVKDTYLNTTLHGAGVDFTGLAVNKNYYQNGTSVNYMASVKNQSNSSDTIYMSMTVPTNQYNPIETSNNTQPAFIHAITALYPTTQVYYQRASLATPMDIEAMKKINQPGTNLGFYYDNVITLNWTLYHNGDVLPNDVVMLAAKTTNVAQGEVVRVDYTVKVEMDINTTNTYVNDAAINYYSTASTLETQSNKVTIQNYKRENTIVITKTPQTQTVKGAYGTDVSFTLTFKVPPQAVNYESFILKDTLAPSLYPNTAACTLQIGASTPIALNPMISGNTIIKDFTQMLAQIAGQTIKITLGATVNNLAQIPLNFTDHNQAELAIDNASDLVSKSNIVDIVYYFEDLFHIRKEPLSQNHPKTLGEKVEFKIYFDVPLNITGLYSMTIEDVLADALKYDAANSLIQIGNEIVEPLIATEDGQKIIISFNRIAEAAGKTVKITLGTTLNNLSALPTDNIVTNGAKLIVNNAPAYSFKSNIVNAVFGAKVSKVPITKSPQLQTVAEIVGTGVIFELKFTMPADLIGYQTLTVTDKLHESLKYNGSASTIKIGSDSPIPLIATEINNEITAQISIGKAMAGKEIVITLAATVNDLNKIPSSMQIINNAQLLVNNDLSLLSTSNDVIVKFKSKIPNPRCQAITDLIQSVALEQAAIVKILDGEGKKIQLAATMNIPSEIRNEINNSAQSTMDSITILEHILKKKLDTVICDECNDNFDK